MLRLRKPTTRPWGSPNLSPFAIKLETYLKLRRMPYESRPADPRVAPKGKVPYVELDDGTRMGDSQLVIEHLERTVPGGLDVGISAADRATGHLVQRTLDEAHYFVTLTTRWANPAGIAHNRLEFLRVLPRLLRPAFPLILRKVQGSLKQQGTGRHSLEEVQAIGIRDWDAIAQILGDKPFLLGDSPRSVDASVFAFLAATIPFPLACPVRQHVLATPNLAAYHARIMAQYFA